MRRLLLAAAIALLPAAASAQSGCTYIVTGAVLTSAQWNFCFQQKNDALGFTPVNRGGDTMQGELTTQASAIAHAGFNLPLGAAPTVPVDGALWTTSAGLFVQVGGVTYGPLGGAISTLANLTVAGSIYLAGNTFQTIAGDQNDYDPTGAANVERIYVNGGAVDRNITGLARGAMVEIDLLAKRSS